MGMWSQAMNEELAARLVSGDAKFGFEEGSVERGDLGDLSVLYSEVLHRRFEEAGLKVERAQAEFHADARFVEIDAENADGSTFRLSLQVDDLGHLDLCYADGISVQNGNQVDLGFQFEGREHAFRDMGDVDAFLGWAKDW